MTLGILKSKITFLTVSQGVAHTQGYPVKARSGHEPLIYKGSEFIACI